MSTETEDVPDESQAAMTPTIELDLAGDDLVIHFRHGEHTYATSLKLGSGYTAKDVARAARVLFRTAHATLDLLRAGKLPALAPGPFSDLDIERNVIAERSRLCDRCQLLSHEGPCE